MIQGKAKLGVWVSILAVVILFSVFQVSQNRALGKLEGDEIEISTHSGDQQNPHGIFLPDKNLWFVVYEDHSEVSKGSEIKGLFVRPDGTTCGKSFTISSDTPGNGNQTVPRAAYRDGAGKADPTDRILVLWQDTRSTTNVGGYIYYAALDVSSYTPTESICALPSSSGEFEVLFEDDDPNAAGTQSYVTSRSLPRVTYDTVKDRFLMAWVESRNSQKTVSYIPFPLPATEVSWKFGDTSFVGYGALKGDLSGYETSPTIIYHHNEGGSAYTRVRRLSSSKEAYKEKRVYEAFNGITNLDLSCDSTSNECLIIWEGFKEEITVENTCKDDPSESTSNGICDNNDIVTSSASSQVLDNSKAIYGLFEKNFGLSIPSFKVSSSKDDCYYPSLGFDPVTKKFLAAWETLGEGGYQKIYGQLIFSGGGSYNKNFLISYQDTDGDGNQDENILNSKQTRPHVSYDSVNQRYFVTWQDGRNGSISIENLDIYGQYVDSEGTLRGTNYAISTQGSNQLAPVTVYNPLENLFLTVWKDGRNTSTTGSDIYGQRFSLGQPQLTLLKLDNTPLAPALIDFGSITKGQFSTYSFKIKNTGDVSISVDCISPDPATLTPFSFSNLPKELAACSEAGSATQLTLVPSAEVTLTTKFSPDGEGTFMSSFTIKSNAGERTVALQGISVSPDLTLQEGDGTDDGTLAFGSIKPNQTKDLTFSLVNNGTIEYQVTSIAGISGPFSIVENPTFPFTLLPGQQKTFTVRFAPVERATHLVEVVINTDKPGLKRTLWLQASCIAPVLKLNPTFIDFGTQKANTTTNSTVAISNEGDDDLIVSSCGSFPQGFSLKGSCPEKVAAGESKSLTIQFSPTDVVTYEGTINIQTNGGNQGVILKGAGKGGKVAITPSQLDFGVIVVNSQAVLPLEIRNEGNDTLTITSITSLSSPYSLNLGSALPATLQPNTTITALINFSPNNSGLFTSSITISTDAINGNQTVSIQGQAIQSKVTITPFPVGFEQIQVGETSSMLLSIKNENPTKVKILSIDPPLAPFSISNQVTTPYEMASGETVQLVVKFSPIQAGQFGSNMKILFDFKPTPITVGISGSAIAQLIQKGEIVFKEKGVEVTYLDFGSVVKGGLSQKELVIENKTTKKLTLLSPGVSEGFKVEGTFPMTLSEYGSQGYTSTVSVKFLPTQVKSYEGNISFNEKDSQFIYQLSVVGAGVKAAATSTTDGIMVETIPLKAEEIPGAKPSNFQAKDAVSVYLTNAPEEVSLTFKFSDLPSNPVFYKVDKNNNWCKLYPSNACSGISNVQLKGGDLSFKLKDNSDCDKDPQIGVIYDPIVVGDETATTTTTQAGTGTGTTTGTGGGAGGGGSCFIATAAYGSGLHPYVVELKRFRDRHLMSNPVGRSFVGFYYRVSPPIAEIIAQNEALRAVVRIGLYPVVFAVLHPFLLIIPLSLGALMGIIWVQRRGSVRNRG